MFVFFALNWIFLVLIRMRHILMFFNTVLMLFQLCRRHCTRGNVHALQKRSEDKQIGSRAMAAIFQR